MPDRIPLYKYTELFYRRHGVFHLKWWSQELIVSKATPIQIYSNSFSEDGAHSIVVYVCCGNKNIDTDMRNAIMRYIDGKTHIFCNTH